MRADVSQASEGEPPGGGDGRPLRGLDALVVNHGIWKRASIHDDDARRSGTRRVRVNLGGVYAVCHHASRHMMRQGSGAIVTIASTSGQRGEAHYSHYSATKGAIIAFTKSLAAELAPHGIRVNGVAPGWVLTDMTREALEGAGAEAAAAAIPSAALARRRRSPGRWPSCCRTWPRTSTGRCSASTAAPSWPTEAAYK